MVSTPTTSSATITRRPRAKSLSPSNISSSASSSSPRATVRYSLYPPLHKLSLSSESEGESRGDGAMGRIRGLKEGATGHYTLEASLRNRTPRQGRSPVACTEKPRPTHRRTLSLDATSYGYMLFPTPSKDTSTKTCPIAAPSPPQCMTPTLPSTPEEPGPQTASHPAPLSPIKVPPPSPGYSTSVSPWTQQRLFLVNPAIAAHLKRGGAVSVRSVDGARSWKVYLPVPAAKSA